MSTSGSISQWILSLKESDQAAAQKLWDRYADRLISLAKVRLGRTPITVADEDDIAQSVFHSLCRGAANGRFGDIRNRDDLWWILLAITKQKVVNLVRREMALKRGAGRVVQGALGVSPDGEPYTLDWIVGDEPTPDEVVMLEEEHLRLFISLRDDRLRQVAAARLEGYTVSEIAATLAISTRSVERKLQLVRKAWAKELTIAD